MKRIMILLIIALAVPAASAALPTAGADSGSHDNSNIGLKLELGLGSQDVPASQKLERGGAFSLSLGYGVSQHVTIWLGMNESEHIYEENSELKSNIVGVDIGVQYKFRPHQKFRPYGAIRLGPVFLGSEGDHVLRGGYSSVALGVEYRLVRFLSVGAEIFWKDVEYREEGLNGIDGDFVKLSRPVNGDTNGFMINFTLQ